LLSTILSKKKFYNFCNFKTIPKGRNVAEADQAVTTFSLSPNCKKVFIKFDARGRGEGGKRHKPVGV